MECSPFLTTPPAATTRLPVSLHSVTATRPAATNTANLVTRRSSNTTANGNTATGFQALLNNTTGGFNTANGTTALISNTTGGGNVATGFQALNNNTIGGANTAIGGTALQSNTTGGATRRSVMAHSLKTQPATPTQLWEFRPARALRRALTLSVSAATGANVNNSCFIGNIHGVTTAINDAIPVVIDSAGQLGTVSSS